VGRVVIGMDPHKRSATIEIIDHQETVLAGGRFGTDRDGYRAMLVLGRRHPQRMWAVEGCYGIGRHIAQRLVADGETVLDVPGPGVRRRSRADAPSFRCRFPSHRDSTSPVWRVSLSPAIRRTARGSRPGSSAPAAGSADPVRRDLVAAGAYGFRATPQKTGSSAEVTGVPGSGRQVGVRTTPGAISCNPSKKLATCSGVRRTY
jgi:hypothetical protein